VFNPASPRPTNLQGFAESDGVVSIKAEHFTSKTDRHGVGWQVIPGLGHTGNDVAVFPTTAASVDTAKLIENAPVLEYAMSLFTTGKVAVICSLVPTFPLKYGQGLRYAVGLDRGTPQVVTLKTEAQTPPWSQNVLNAAITGSTTLEVATAGLHVLRIYMVDPGVVLDKIVVDAGGLRPSYLGPPETKVFTATR
jgi:glycosyl hydrolase family 115